MIHIKETEIIPFLKTAQTGYTKMISEGSRPDGKQVLSIFVANGEG